MANVYRSEVVFKSDSATFADYLLKYFSLDNDRLYFDLNKVIPLNGEDPFDVWGCESEAYNFEVIIFVPDEMIVFRFDSNFDGPGVVLSKMAREYIQAEISITTCCEMMSDAISLATDAGSIVAKVTKIEQGDLRKKSRKLVEHYGQRLWGYKKAPRLEDRGFIKVGDTYLKLHYGVSLEDIRPRFKKP